MYIFNLTVFKNVAYRLELARIEKKKYVAKKFWNVRQPTFFFLLYT